MCVCCVYLLSLTSIIATIIINCTPMMPLSVSKHKLDSIFDRRAFRALCACLCAGPCKILSIDPGDWRIRGGFSKKYSVSVVGFETKAVYYKLRIFVLLSFLAKAQKCVCVCRKIEYITSNQMVYFSAIVWPKSVR